jgi:hypothetical protein
MPKKIILVAIFLSLAFINSKAQPKWMPEVYSGISAGQENVVFSLPKVMATLTNNHHHLKPYIGTDLGFWFIFAGFASATIYGGVHHQIFITEAGMGRAWYDKGPNTKGGSYYTTNWKVGINLKKIQLKMGPTFILNDIAPENNFLKMGNIPLTFTFGYKINNKPTAFKNYKANN